MSGVNRIAINSNDSQVSSAISRQINATGKYTVAPEAELRQWEQWRDDRQQMEQLKNRQTTATEISSAELVGAYNANAVRADSSYRKLLRTSGVVAEIGKSSGGISFARISVGNDSLVAYFVSSESNRLASVDKGQTITFVGDCIGFDSPSVGDIAEILRILGGGRRVSIVEATFPVEQIMDYPGTVDAVIIMNKATNVNEGTSTASRPAKDADGNTIKDADGKTVYQNVTIYERSVTVAISFQIMRTRDGSLIGQGTKSATSSKSSNEDRSKLASASDLESKTIDKPIQELAGEIVPTQRTMSLTLAKPDDKAAKKEMSEAEKLVKTKDYKDAAAAYGKIYTQYGNFAAGYNQALLTEASAGTQAAIGLMEALFTKTNNPTAQKTLEEMKRRNASNQQAAQQLSS